jgi:hypothetical protein
VLPTGTYKVLPGQGPQGTDVVRTCSDVVGRQRVGNDDVKGRVGRVDGTCGYFATEADGSLPTLSSSSPSASLSGSASSAHKDEVAARHRALLLRAAQARGRARSQPCCTSSGGCRKLFQLRKQLDEAAQRLQRERQVHPDRADLRFRRDGRVARQWERGTATVS